MTRGKRFMGFGRAVLGARATRVVLAVGVLWFPIWHLAAPQGDSAAKAAAPADGAPRPIVPLNSVPVPKPQNLSQFVKDESAGIKLGKAMFWDMQVGSDGVTSCASCHFAAGADNRSKNQINPRVGAFDTHKPNYQLKADDFPFHKLADINDRNSTVLSDTNEVSGSAGVLPSTFNSILPGTATENVTPAGTDPIFNVGGVNVRRATGRNAPSVINAVFNFRNFWDGRAQNDFNGVDPFGMRDTNAKVAQVVNGQSGLVSLASDCALVNGIPQVRGPLCLNNSSLAS